VRCRLRVFRQGGAFVVGRLRLEGGTPTFGGAIGLGGRFKALHSPTIPCGFLVHSWSPGGFLVYSFHSCPFPGVLGKSWFIPTPFPVHSWSIPRTGGSGYGGEKGGGECMRQRKGEGGGMECEGGVRR
jgi:hypothetical protein